MNHKYQKEPTPLCDEKAFRLPEDGVVGPDYILADTARDLEKRLRHAWKLVNSLRIDAQYDTDPGNEYPLDPELLEQRLADIEEVMTP